MNGTRELLKDMFVDSLVDEVEMVGDTLHGHILSHDQADRLRNEVARLQLTIDNAEVQ